jgi:hypothetical protein
MRLMRASRVSIAFATTAFFVAALTAAPAAPVFGTATAGASDGTPRFNWMTPTSKHTPLSDLTATQRKAIHGEALVDDEGAYGRAKAAADNKAAAGARTAGNRGGPHAPSTLGNFQGVNDTNFAPSDSTSAIGTQRYVELVNAQAAIYNRTSTTPLVTASLNTLTGAGTGPMVFDPQVMWDPTTQRFYFTTDVVVSASQNFLAWGFSTTASPTNATTDWCRYTIAYNALFPDYPKLGDMAGLSMIGVNVFSGNSFVRSDVVALTKPAAGTTCPAPSAFTFTAINGLTNADASQTTTPLPVNQVDDASPGFVLGGKGFSGGNFISVFNTTVDSTHHLVLAPARAMSVPAFSVPARAPQPGTTRKLDTLDTRLTQAVSAIDPSHSNQVGIWTQHTVFGGAGAQVRWYEINPTPATPVPFQSGTQTSSSLFLYNAAISPDRRRNGASGMYGDGMLLQYSRSSTADRISIAAVSKVGTGAVTGENVLLTSSSVIDDFSCVSNVCRWGDYSGASPDPASDTTQAHGVVWGVNAFAGSSGGTFADWRTQNFALRVSPK